VKLSPGGEILCSPLHSSRQKRVFTSGVNKVGNISPRGPLGARGEVMNGLLPSMFLLSKAQQKNALITPTPQSGHYFIAVFYISLTHNKKLLSLLCVYNIFALHTYILYGARYIHISVISTFSSLAQSQSKCLLLF
jgi:hypothetical protein